jgi:5-methylcytosine-specific restriction endonuclease McrA
MEENSTPEIKTVYYPVPTKTNPDHEMRKRIATANDKWIFTDTTTAEIQLNLLSNIQEPVLTETAKFVIQQVAQKIHGYRSQDVEKQIYHPEFFVDLSFVIKKLDQCELSCFYCRETTKIIYEYARDPKQWTLERIDNRRGHNRDNVEIACLNCNLRRRTMYFERFRFTKQMKIKKQTDDEIVMEDMEDI